jgi:predicted RNA-binding protein with RPS1 domain
VLSQLAVPLRPHRATGRDADFGAFVEIFPGTDGLLPISEIAENRITDVRDELKEGDQILVKCLALEGNKIKLSRKACSKSNAKMWRARRNSFFRKQVKTGACSCRRRKRIPAATLL